jgi:antitoxin CptB
MPASNPTDLGASLGVLEPQALGRLKWRCRRGLLENDLFVQRFFACHEAELTLRQADGLARLMDLADNDLLDLLLARRTDGPGTETQEAREVLVQMRRAMANKA